MSLAFSSSLVTPPPSGAAPTRALLNHLAAITGPAGYSEDAADLAPRLIEDRGLFRGAAAALIRPKTVAETAAVVTACAQAGVAITPQAGNTGHSGAGVPAGGVVVALDRMTAIRAIDETDMTMTVEAGCVLQTIKDAAAARDLFFPLALGSQGSCQAGGFLSSNAGGINTLRYGNARDLALGLEVVLPDGRVWSRLRALRKDNAGYALRHLFMGAEGTLGLITAAVLRLFPAPKERATAFLALPDLAAAPKLLARLRSASGDAVSGFEAMAAFAVDSAVAHIPGVANPVPGPHPWYALVELTTTRPGAGLRDVLESALAAAMEDALVTDGALAESADQAARFWRLRESLPEAQKHAGASIKHDVSVPVSAVPAFVAEACKAALEIVPGCRPCPFGHVGDGNVHFNVTQPEGGDRDAFLGLWGTMNAAVFAVVDKYGGSIAAEHGVGLLRADALPGHAGETHVDLMRAIRGAFDPAGIMNPGKVTG